MKKLVPRSVLSLLASGKSQADYGRSLGIVLSALLHVLVLLAFWGFSYTKKKQEPRLNAMVVKLGGPANLAASGKKHKAPVAGVSKKKRKKVTIPPKKKPPKRKTARPKPKKSKGVGLNQKKKQPAKPKASGSGRSEKKDPQQEPPQPPSPREKGARAIGGLDGTKGVGVSIETGDGAEDINVEDLEFISYFRSVQAELAARWVKSGLSGGSVKIRFFINRNGEVSQVSVAASSGKSYLDAPAKRAVLGAEFPPLPQGYRGEKLIVNINFHYGKRK